jgi:hypothetical protein
LFKSSGAGLKGDGGGSGSWCVDCWRPGHRHRRVCCEGGGFVPMDILIP